MQRALTIFLTLALLFSGMTSFGQTTTATITGTVTDPSGAVVPSAKVSVTSETEGTVRDVLTGSTGVFTVPNLNVGRYRLQVTASGFATYELTGSARDRFPVAAGVLRNHENQDSLIASGGGGRVCG
jgi:hypothetical protein